MNTQKKVGKMLAEAREMKGLSQGDVAKLLDPLATKNARTNISKIELGKRGMSLDFLERYAKALGCELEIFLVDPKMRAE